MTNELATINDPKLIETVVVGGDLSSLSAGQRLEYYTAVCNSLGLNPLTKPFDYIKLNSRLVLYAKRDATDQLRKIHKVSITGLEKEVVEDIYIVTATAQDGDGRTDTATGAVNIASLKGDAKANALMKAETKAKRRVTLSIVGLGWLDETEIESMNTSVTLTAGYTYRPNSDWQLNSVVSSGFRSPNIDDIGKIREKNGDVTVPNVDLEPEYAYNFEAGFIKYFDEKKTYIGVTTYYTLLNNYIVRGPFELNGNSQIIYDGEMANIVANVNKGNAFLFGGTMTFKSQLTNTWNARASLTYTRGRAYDTDEPLSSVPPLFGMLELDYVRNRIESGINVVFNGRKKAGDYNTSEGIDNIEQTPYVDAEQAYYGSPSWYTLNYFMRIKTSKFLDVLINVDNIMDHHYKEFASAISAPGRNFSLTLIGSF